MQNVFLIVHLILALCLIGVVLLQRSEGGGLGLGGGSGVMTGRGVTSALGKLTWGLALAFIATSIALTILAARSSSETSVLDRLGGSATQTPGVPTPALPEGDLLPPPPPSGGGGTAPDVTPANPLAPPRAD
jgi:preprotein translocase subunit SecG